MAGPAHYDLPLPDVKSGKSALIVCAPYYKGIADNLVSGARSMLDKAQVTHELVEVPGALEIATVIAMAARSGRFDGFVALGCVIRGETTHYETVCNDSSRALSQLGLKGIAIGNGILTVETHEQAAVRADPKGQNNGGGAAAAAIHLMHHADTLFEKKSIGFAPASEHILMAGGD